MLDGWDWCQVSNIKTFILFQIIWDSHYVNSFCAMPWNFTWQIIQNFCGRSFFGSFFMWSYYTMKIVKPWDPIFPWWILKIWLYKSFANDPRVVSNSVALWQCNNNSHSLHVKTSMEFPYLMNDLHLIFGMTINITFITNNDIATVGILIFAWNMVRKVNFFDKLSPLVIILYKIPFTECVELHMIIKHSIF